MDKLRIGVFFTDGKIWKLLPETSKMISDKNITPAHGDRITTIGDDFKVMNLDSVGDFKSVVTVKERVHRYVDWDLAIICNHQVW